MLTFAHWSSPQYYVPFDMATSQIISKAASTSSSLTNNQSKNNNNIQEADSTYRLLTGKKKPVFSCDVNKLLITYRGHVLSGRALNHCCFCGILLDPKNLSVNVNTQSITVWCSNCRKTNALAGKIRHDKKGKEEKRKMWSTPHQQTVQSQN